MLLRVLVCDDDGKVIYGKEVEVAVIGDRPTPSEAEDAIKAVAALI